MLRPRRLRSRLTYANAMATIAVFIALGGTSYAALTLPADSVGTPQIRKAAVTLLKISPAAQHALRGARGPQGARGAQGPEGAQGPQGVAGTSGAQGATGPTWGTSTGDLNPPATPNSQAISRTFMVTVPAAGHLLVMAQWQALENGCASSNAIDCNIDFGLYLDGQPISGTDHEVMVAPNYTDTSTWAFAGVVAVTAGSHVLKIEGADTNGTTLGPDGGGSASMQAVLLG